MPDGLPCIARRPTAASIACAPCRLVQRAHAAFIRLPYESNHERVAEEIGRILASMKARQAAGRAALLGAAAPAAPAAAAAAVPGAPPTSALSPQEVMFGDDEGGGHASKENALVVAHEACRTELLSEFVTYVAMVEFESRRVRARMRAWFRVRMHPP